MSRIGDLKLPPSRWRAVAIFLTMFGAGLLTNGLLWGWWLGHDWALWPILPGVVLLSTGLTIWILLLRGEWVELKEDR